MERTGSVQHPARDDGKLVQLRSLSDTLNSSGASGLAGKYNIKSRVELYKGSVSTVFKCQLVGGSAVVVKQYHKAKMQDKHFHKLAREVEAMRALLLQAQQQSHRGSGSGAAESSICSSVGGGSGSGATESRPQTPSGVCPGVVQLLDTFEDSASVYLVMECCEGGDLFKKLMLHSGRLPEGWVAAEVIGPLLQVLHRMHGLRLMHRDIKPENIFLTAEGDVKLGDFGLAIDWSRELAFSRSGTLDYMAPEVLINPATHLQESAAVTAPQLAAKNIRPYTAAVDVWAVGCLAYELISGRPPFEVEDEKQTASNIIYSNNIRFDPAHSAAWADFVAQALIKDPRRRPTAAALLAHPWLAAHRIMRSNSGGTAASGMRSTASLQRSSASSVADSAPTAAAAAAIVAAATTMVVVASKCHPPAHPAAPAASCIGGGSTASSSACGGSDASGTSSASSSSGSGVSAVSAASAAPSSASTQPRPPLPPPGSKIAPAAAVVALPPPPATTVTQVRPRTPSAGFTVTTGASVQLVAPASPSVQPATAAATPSTPAAAATATAHNNAQGPCASVPPQSRTGPPTSQQQQPASQTPGSIPLPRTPNGNALHNNSALRSLLDAFKSAAVGGHSINNQQQPAGSSVAQPAPASGEVREPALQQVAAAPGVGASSGSSQRASWSQWQQQATAGGAVGAPLDTSSGGASSTVAVVGGGWRSPPVSPMRERFPEGSAAAGYMPAPQPPLPRAPSNGRAGAAPAPQPQYWVSPTQQPPAAASGADAVNGGVMSAPLSSSVCGFTSPQRMGHRISSSGLLSSMMRPVASISATGTSSSSSAGNSSSGQLPPAQAQQQPMQAHGTGAKPCGRPRSGSPSQQPLACSSAAAAVAATSPLRRALLGLSPPRQMRPSPTPSPPRQMPQVQPQAPVVGQQPCPSPPRQQQPPNPSPPRSNWVHAGSNAAAPANPQGPSPAIMHDLTRNWGAVVSVSVNAGSSNPPAIKTQASQAQQQGSAALIPSNRSSSTGTGDRFASPQRSNAGSLACKPGFDSWGLPVTPGAAALPPQEFATPRPTGVLERVKYHLRGGAQAQAQQMQQQLQSHVQQAVTGHLQFPGVASVAAVDAV
ncbi:hypothetical protein HXX76_002940 [Chlamydomonas incerta]|uniref:Protein kinase domain-containing protein n=1 Tax=Chlamydomonas incerta TaxID=51695 RepID=A0A835TEY8_CHLIN|nr:hypothetical protein HXX76_002940 [Chlamydomonas incerta]|eukprot:KAG2442861.1 hypothetical protein HXX76_002940 [Chlamydomonas incerta]